MFTPQLNEGDFVAVHDWGTEFHESDLSGDVEFYMQDECESIESMTRFFRVTRHNGATSLPV